MLIQDILYDKYKNDPQKIALIIGGNEYPYERVFKDSLYLANNLLSFGISKGERILIYIENSYEAVISIFGSLIAGCPFVPINPKLKGTQLSSILYKINPSVIITKNKLFEKIKDKMRTELVLLVDEAKSQNRILSFKDFLKNNENDYSHRIIDKDIAAIILTTGSTGNPKGVTLTHHNMITSIKSINNYLENKSDEIILNLFPFSFDYGLYQVFLAFSCGGTLILYNDFIFISNIIDIIKKHKVTAFPIVPAIGQILKRIKKMDSSDFSSIRYFSNTAQKIPEEIILFILELVPNARFYSMYGLTECKRVSFLSPNKIRMKPGSVGKPMSNVDVFLINENGKIITTPYTEGELVVRGSNIMIGYWNDPDETKKILSEDFYPFEKVLLSGDIFYYDDEGDLYYKSRKDDMFKIGGEKVYPLEIENILLDYPQVKGAAVVAIDDEIMGNRIIAYIKTENKIEIEKIYNYLKEKIRKEIIPRKIFIIDDFPLNLNGKIDKELLKNM